MEKETGFTIDILKLDNPIHIVGRGVRVRHGSPECFPTIDSLIAEYFADDVTSRIPNKKKPIIRFGICADHVPDGEFIDFTYMIGVQVQEPVMNEKQLPETTRSYTIPEGEYARIKVAAPTIGTAIGIGYVNVEQWINESSEWEAFADGIYEVYVNESPSWIEMEVWRSIKRKEQPR